MFIKVYLPINNVLKRALFMIIALTKTLNYLQNITVLFKSALILKQGIKCLL